MCTKRPFITLLSRETRSLLNPAITSSTEKKGRALISVIRSPESGDIREPIAIVVTLQVSCATAESQPNSCETAMNLPTRESDSRMSRVIYRINSELVAVAKIRAAISTDPRASVPRVSDDRSRRRRAIHLVDPRSPRSLPLLFLGP